jgi:hypothetical protein
MCEYSLSSTVVGWRFGAAVAACPFDADAAGLTAGLALSQAVSGKIRAMARARSGWARKAFSIGVVTDISTRDRAT